MNGLKSLGKTRETATIGDGLKVLQKHLKPMVEIDDLIPRKQIINNLSPSFGKARGLYKALRPIRMSKSSDFMIQDLRKNDQLVNKALFPGTPAADKARTEEIVNFMRPSKFEDGRSHIWQQVYKLLRNEY